MPRVSDAQRPKSGPGSALSTSLHARSRGIGGRRHKSPATARSISASGGAGNSRGEKAMDACTANDDDAFSVASCGVVGKKGPSTPLENIEDNDNDESITEIVGWQKENRVVQNRNGGKAASAGRKRRKKSPSSGKKKSIAGGPNGGKEPYTSKKHQGRDESTCKRTPSSARKKMKGATVRFQDGTKSGRDVTHAEGETSRNTSTTPPSSPCSSSATTQRPIHRVPSNSRAVAIDTRILQTFEGDAAGQMFLGHTLNFLKSSARRGALPSIFATTHATLNTGSSGEDRKKQNAGVRQPRAVIDARAAQLPSGILRGRSMSTELNQSTALIQNLSSREEKLWNDLLTPVHVRCAGSTKNKTAVHVPKSLLAHDTWRLLGDLVNVATSESSRMTEESESASAGSVACPKPMDLTIISNDVSLFTDTNVDSHKRGLDRFWERIRGSFQTNLGNITIIVAETGMAAIMPKEIQTKCGTGNRGYENLHKDQANGPGVDEVSGTQNEHESANASHRLKIAECVRMIRKRLAELSDADYKRTSSTKNGPHVPVCLHFEVMRCNPIAYESLLQKWIRDIMSPGSAGGRLHFDLPETIDGTQCSISLDLSYTILPHRADSPATVGLLSDMRLLRSSTVELVQVMPLSCVDASLVYGVPISARAGMESDLLRYKEMRLLCRQLWKFLATNDVALLLRCRNSRDDATDESGEGWGYQTGGQCFLLMAEEVVQPLGFDEQEQHELSSSIELKPAISRRGQEPGNGILYRYATIDQLLRSASEKESSESTLSDDDDLSSTETSRQYFEYIERSLEYLDKAGLNPAMMKNANEYKQHMSTVSSEESLSIEKEICTQSDIDQADMVDKDTSVKNDANDVESLDEEIHDDDFGSMFDPFDYS